MLSRLVITFLPRSKCLLISWLQSPSAVILEPPKIKSDTVSIISPSICHEVMGPDAMIFSECWVLSQLFHSLLSVSSRGSLVLHFLPYGWCHLHIWGYCYFSQQSGFQLVLLPAQRFSWCTLHEGEGEVAQLYPALCDPVECNLLGSSVHGILQAGVLEWVAMPSSRGSSRSRDQTFLSHVSCMDR